MSTAAPIPMPGESPDPFPAWLRSVALACGTVSTSDGGTVAMFELKQRIGEIPPGSHLSRRTLRAVFDSLPGNSSGY